MPAKTKPILGRVLRRKSGEFLLLPIDRLDLVVNQMAQVFPPHYQEDGNFTGYLRFAFSKIGVPMPKVRQRYWEIIGQHTGEVIGVCSDQADVLAEEPGATFNEITATAFNRFNADKEWTKPGRHGPKKRRSKRKVKRSNRPKPLTSASLKRGDIVELDCGHNGMIDMLLCKLLEDPSVCTPLFPDGLSTRTARVEICGRGEVFGAAFPAASTP